MRPYIPYYNRRSVLTCTAPGVVVSIWVCAGGAAALRYAPTWGSRYYSRLCRSGIYSGRIGQISGNTTVKPCALFCGVGDITLHGWNKTLCKRLYGAIFWQGKIKALHLQQMQGKRKTRPFLTGWNVFYLDALNSAEKNQKKNRTQDNIILCSPPPKH